MSPHQMAHPGVVSHSSSGLEDFFSPTVRSLLGMAILNLTELHHVGRPPFFLAFLLLYSILGLPGIGLFPGMDVLSLRGMY